MEGELDIRDNSGPLGRWKSKYFVLAGDVMSYCDSRGGEVEGRFHLEVSAFDYLSRADGRFDIRTGAGRLKLRASSPSSKAEWIKAM